MQYSRNPLVVSLALGAFIVCLVFFGGSSRDDSLGQIPVRVAAVGMIAMGLALANSRVRWRSAPFVFLGCCAALVALQLIPLPASVWTQLPGRAIYQPAAALAGIVQPWRPIDVTPDAGLNALLSFLPPLGALVALEIRRGEGAPLSVLLTFVVAGAILGFVQLAGGETSPLRFYRLASIDAVGFFANRNHHALALAIGIIVTWAWWLSDPGGRLRETPRLLVAGAVTSLAVVGITVTGSRAGLIAAVMALTGSFLLWIRAPSPSRPMQAQRSKRYRLIVASMIGVIALAGIALAFSPRAQSMHRLLENSTVEDLRWRSRGTVERMTADYFPVGSGFGSFSQIYEHYEPLELMNYSYFNHAHDDLLELILEGGIIGMMLLVAFLVWWVRANVRVWRQIGRTRDRIIRGRAGAMVTALIIGSSLVDYPLRTPLIACIFATACWWLCEATGGERRFGGDGTDFTCKRAATSASSIER